MVSLIQKLRDDLKVAMKAGDTFALGVLRMVISALNNKSIEKRGKPRATNEVVTQGRRLDAELTDEEVLTLLGQEAKRRKEAASLYEKGGRTDLADQERKEAAFIQKYLPVQMSKEEIVSAVEKIISAAHEGGDDVSFTSIIKEAMKELKGKTEGKLVGEVIKEKLQN